MARGGKRKGAGADGAKRRKGAQPPPALLLPAVEGGAEAEPPGERVVYCPECPCLDNRIHELHADLLRGQEGAEFEIDRHLTACALFANIAAQPPVSRAAGGVAVSVECLCGNPSHTVRLYKASLECGFESHRLTRGKAAAAKKQARAARGVALFAETLVSAPETTVQYGLLPDIGRFLHAVLQKRFFSTGARKQCAKVAVATPPEGGGGRGSSGSHSSRAGAQAAEAMLSRPRVSLAQAAVDSVCAAMLQDGIPCLRRAKRSNRAAEPDPSCRHELVACVNIMHGTLLKLYPLGAKRPIFTARVRMLRRLGELMRAPADEIAAFIHDHPSLMKLCFMEYALNVMVSYMPVERHLLLPCEGGSGAPAGPHAAQPAGPPPGLGRPAAFPNGVSSMYESVCVAMCDSFRQETVLTGAEAWAAMNAAAFSSIERCVRICRFRMLRVREPVLRVSVPHEGFHARALEMRHMMGDVLGLRCMHPGAGGEEVVFASILQRAITRHPLPAAVVQQQRESLWALHSRCFRTMRAHQNFDLCVLCAINGRMGKTKMRMCASTGALSCTSCPPGTIVRVCMLGIVLKICNTNFYMCPCCTRVCAWHADGMDLCPGVGSVLEAACGPWAGNPNIRTIRQQAVASAAAACAGFPPGQPHAHHGATGEFGCRCMCGPRPEIDALAQSDVACDASVGARLQERVGWAPGVPRCVVCDSRHVSWGSAVAVPDHARGAMCHAHFCARHVLPEFLARNVYGTDDLRAAIRAHQGMDAARRSGRR